MDGLTAVAVALIGTVGTVLVAAIRARHKSGQSSTAARWKEQAELERARADLFEEQAADERGKAQAAVQAMRELEGELVTTRRELATAKRELDDAYSELRAISRRRRTPRSTS